MREGNVRRIGAVPGDQRAIFKARNRFSDEGHGGNHPPAARNTARIRCGVAGSSSIETPKGASATLTALRIAAGAPIAPPSPKPLAPVMEDAAGDSMWCNSIGGISHAVGGV